MNNIYNAKVYCLNCKAEMIISVPFGQAIQKQQCPNCKEYKLWSEE